MKKTLLVFSEELKESSATDKTKYVIGDDTNKVTKATYSWDATTGKATVILDLTTPLTTAAAVNVKAVNLAGVEAVDPTTPSTLTDNVAPSVKSVVANIVKNDAGDVNDDDTIEITFNDSDLFYGAGTSKVLANDLSHYTIYENGTPLNLDTAKNVAITVTDSMVTFKFNSVAGNGKEVINLKKNATYTVAITGIQDTTGNVMANVTKTATFAANTDDDGPVISSATSIAGEVGVAGITVKYDEAVDEATATDKSNYQIKLGETVLGISGITYAAATKTATLFTSEMLNTQDVYTLSVNNVTDVAGNKITKVENKEVTKGSGVVAAKVPSEAVVKAMIDYKNETITVPNTYQVSVDTGVSSWGAGTGVAVSIKDKLDSDSLSLNVKLPALPNVYKESEATTIALSRAAAAAVTTEVDYVNETITVPATEEYLIDNGTTWTTGTGNSISISTALDGTNGVKVRVKATDSAFASEAKDLTRPTKPVGTTATGAEGKIKNLENTTEYEYSKDGTTVAGTVTSDDFGFVVMPEINTDYYLRVKAISSSSFASEWSASIKSADKI